MIADEPFGYKKEMCQYPDQFRWSLSPRTWRWINTSYGRTLIPNLLIVIPSVITLHHYGGIATNINSYRKKKFIAITTVW